MFALDFVILYIHNLVYSYILLKNSFFRVMQCSLLQLFMFAVRFPLRKKRFALVEDLQFASTIMTMHCLLIFETSLSQYLIEKKEKNRSSFSVSL